MLFSEEMIKMEKCKIKNLYNLDETIAKELLESVTYPWEALPKIEEFIKELGNTLSSEEYEKRGEDIWIAKTATIAPTAYIKGPAIIGESIKRILNLKGYKTIGDVHLGDYGLQIGEVIYGLKKENIPLSELNIDLLNRIYPQMSALAKSDEEVYNECKRITSELQKGNAEYKEYYKKIKEVSVNDIKRLYDYLGVSFDLWLGESDSEPYIPKLMNELESRNLVVVDQGAKIVNIKRDTDKKEMPPVILIKSNGGVLYDTTELATLYSRIKRFDAQKYFYLTDIRQELHFVQAFRAAYKTNLVSKDISLEWFGFGTMNGPDGKPFKTRDGGVMPLRKLIDLVKDETRKVIKDNIKEDMPNVLYGDSEKIKQAVMRGISSAVKDRKDVLDLILSNLAYAVTGQDGALDVYALEKQLKALNDIMDETMELAVNSSGDGKRFQQEIKALSEQMVVIREQLEMAKEKIASNEKINSEIENIKEYLSSSDICFTEYSDVTVRRLVEYIRVMKDNSIIIVLKGGIQIREPIETNN